MRRIHALALLSFSLPLAVFYAAWLLAQTYSIQAVALSHWRSPGPAALAASSHATTLAPWNTAFRKDFAWTLNRRDPLRARAQMRTTLAWAPADGYRWSDHARLLVRQRKFGAETDFALARANRLGPTSAAIQKGHARMALHFWTWGSENLRREWLHSLRFELKRAPDDLLNEVRDSRRVRLFCLGPGAELKLGAWCDRTPWD